MESAAAKARAEVRLSYAEEENNLKLQKTQLEASIEMLKYKKEAAAASAEAEALEAAAVVNSEKCSCKLNFISIPMENTQRTEQYVIDQIKAWETELQLRDNGLSTKMDNFPKITNRLF